MKKQRLTPSMPVSGIFIPVYYPDQQQGDKDFAYSDLAFSKRQNSNESGLIFQSVEEVKKKTLRAQIRVKEIQIGPAMKKAVFFGQIISPKNVKKLKTYCTTRYLFKPLRLNSFKELSYTGNDQANYT